ncbi:hypothetical protein JYT61_00895 [bacterium AH-315-E10]|nr:hypothetical protein [bacterium AH-315-E10]
MEKPTIQYKKLPCKSTFKGLVSLSYANYKLYMADDHILSLELSGYAERYKRYYFSDIEAIMIQPNYYRMIHNIIYGIIFALIGLVLLIAHSDSDSDAFVGLFIFFSPFLFILIVLIILNTFRGMGCKTSILTRTSSEQLKALDRVKKAQKIIPQISEHIVAVQGYIDFENSQPMDIPLQSLNTGKIPSKKERDQEGSEKIFSDYTGRWHKILYPVLILYSMLIFAHVAMHNMFMDIVHTLTLISIFIIIIIAVAKQGKSNLHKPLRFATWSTLCSYIVIFGLMYIALLIGAFENTSMFAHPRLADVYRAFICTIDDIQTFDNVFAILCTFFVVIVNLFLSCYGLYHITQIPPLPEKIISIPQIPDQRQAKQHNANEELGVSIDESINQ